MPTLSAILEALVRLPGLEAVPFTTGIQDDPPDGSFVGVAAGADAARQVVSSELVDLNVAGDGSDTEPSWYGGAYLWLPDLGLQRRVAPDGYDPAALAASATDQSLSTERVGVLTLTRGLGSVVAADTVAELHGPLPPMYDADRKVSLRSYVNRALATMRMPVRITLTGVANAYRYSLAAYPWLRDEGDLIRVSDRETFADQDPYVLPGSSRLRFDGAATYLIVQAPVVAGQAFFVDVYRRRNTWIGVHGGAYADSTVGLVNPDDVCTGPTEHIALLAYWFIAKALAVRDGQGTDPMWEFNAATVAASVAPYLAWGQPEGPTVRQEDRGVWGDHPLFLARREGGRGRRWS